MRTIGLILFFLLPKLFAGQILTVVPENPSTTDYVEITFDAKQGNGELAGFAGDVYAHTGLITTESSNGGDWKHVVGNWGTADPQVLMQRVGNDLYRISFNIAEFYSVNPDSETVLQLAFVFRNEDGSVVGRSTTNGDIFYDINEVGPGNYVSHSFAGGLLTVTTTTGQLFLQPYTNEMVRTEFVASGNSPSGSSFSVILQPENPAFSLTDENDYLRLQGNTLDIIVHKHPVLISYVVNEDTLLSEVTGIYSHGNRSGVNFGLHANEKIYGTGSRAIPLNRRGFRLENYNQAHYGYSYGTENLNISIPFMLSSRDYALFVDNHGPGTFDLGFTNENVLDYQAEEGQMVYFFIYGNSRDEILKNYTDLTGHQPLPPRWALGYIQSRFGYESESEARSIVNSMQQSGFPLDALVLDLYWFGNPSTMGNLSWDTQRFPNPTNMMSDFKNLGVKTILIAEPYVTTGSDNFAYLNSTGYFAKNVSGETYMLNNFWAGQAALLDFTKPQTLDWMWNFYKLRKGEGATGWWSDLGEPEDHPDDMVHATGTARSVHNIFSLLWEQSLYNHYRTEYPTERLFNLSRSGYAGMQRFSVFPWSGDIQKSWDGLKAQVPIMLGMGLCGVGYMGSDIGGFVGDENDELYTRWMEFGTFSPVMRAHGVGVPTEPIFYPDYYKNIVKKYIKLRYQLLPYNYTLAWENSLTGRPLAMPLNYFEPENNFLSETDDEYFWGENLLVAPVLEGNTTSHTVRFPSGLWIDFWGNQTFSGGHSYTVNAPLEKLPLFVKAGSFIPFTENLYSTDFYTEANLSIWYYPDVSVAESIYTLYLDDGKTFGSYANGAYETIRFVGKTFSDHLDVFLQKEGNGSAGTPSEKQVSFEMHRVTQEPVQVLFNSVEMPMVNSQTKYDAETSAAYYLASDHLLKIHFPWDLSNSHLEVKFQGAGIGDVARNGSSLYLGIPVPNPFSEQTSLQVTIPTAGTYWMTVYDVWGRKVYREQYFFAEAGSGTVRWNGKNSSGNRLVNGTYLIVVLDKNGKRAYRKVVLGNE